MINLVRDGRAASPVPDRSGTRVAVVGGGAAGVLATIHLLEAGAAVTLIEPAAQLAAGAAFGTTHPAHLLNVPSARMSAYPDAPDDFSVWLADAGVAGGFVQRGLFGAYLRDRLADAQDGSGALEVVRGTAVDLGRVDGTLVVEICDGRTVPADAVLLALGPPRRSGPPRGAEALRGYRGFVADPWREHALSRIRRGDRALLLGTGLTMVDAALELAARDVELVAVSRRGLVPLAHAEDAPAPVELALPRGLGALVRAVRSGAAAADHWSAAVDAVRPDTQLLWTGLSSREQQRFLRHVAPYWNVHRHRLPPATAAAFRALVEGGGLELLAGRIESARPVGNGIGVDLVLRQTQEVRQTTVTHVVNCMGPALLADETPPLVRSLVARGLTRLDVHGIGLDTGADGRLLDRDGRGAASLFALGALRRGTLWESTAIPEIRDQAATFARMVAQRAAVHAA